VLEIIAMKIDRILEDTFTDLNGDDHVGGAIDTPLRDDAFELSDAEKIKRIEKDMANILETLGMDHDR
jgi:GTP cyclohydrolase I